MKKLVAGLLATTLVGGAALANESVLTLSSNPNDWVLQTGDYANTRYSKLSQINADNVGDLKVAWTFSTGVLRGHEGGPLVIGDVMYVHTPFPNKVFALDLNADGRIIWKYEPKQDPDVIPVMCCDTVNRGPAYANGMLFLHQADTTVVALDAKTGQVKWTAVNGDPTKGETNTATVLPVEATRLSSASRAASSACRAHVTAYDMDDRSSWSGAPIPRARTRMTLMDPENTTHLGKPVGKDSRHRHLGRRSVEDRRRHHLGLVLLRSRGLTSSTTAPATPRPGTRRSAPGDNRGR